MKKVLSTPGAVSLLILLGIALGFLVLRGLGNFLVVRDPLQTADAVVVLSGGGPGRLEYATSLINRKYGRKLVLTETGEEDPVNGGKLSESMSKDARDEGVKRGKQYIAGSEVENTKDEAEAVLKLAKARQWQSLIVVTDTFHSRRTKILFTDVFRNSGISVRVNPVDLPNYWYDPNTWWWSSEARKATIAEYVSLAAYYLGIYP